jgi:hypothetical protein
MLNDLEKSRNKLVHSLFPFVDRFYLLISLAWILLVLSIPRTYWPIRIVLLFLWFVILEIHSAGTMERDCLPIQPGSGPFYHIYRFIDRIFLLLYLVFLVIMLIPGPGWLKDVFLGVLVMALIFRAIGDRKYRPQKQEE